jgi:hypothetical protein
MIVFVGLWLTSTVFLVILYTGQEELRNSNDRLGADKARLISPAEENRIELVRNIVDGGPTAVGLLEKARSQTALLATGEPSHDVSTVRANRDEILGRIRGEGLVRNADSFEDRSFHEALTMLYEAFKEENALRQAAEQRRDELDAEVTDLVEGRAAERNDFDRRLTELGDQLAEVEAAHARFRDERNQKVAELESEFDARQAQTDADLTRQRQLRAAAQKEADEMEKRFAAQQEKFGELMIGPEELATARQPDGRILTAIPGDNVVYVDLGHKDRLTLGLQFAVYSAQTGIPADGRAKGRIEVVSTSESSAECKILHVVGNEVILEGDLIANPVYDPSRPPSFLVVGEFDLDRDGSPDPAGLLAMESLITDWGGVVVNELTALTDFIVLGAAPRRPVRMREPTAEEKKRADAQQRLWDAYMDTVSTARGLSVPVMTQEVFLNFLGYSNRYVGR